MKIAINRCYGGFQLSDRAIEMLMKRKGLECHKYRYDGSVDGYKKVISDDTEGFLDYSTVDLGEFIKEIPSDNYWYYGTVIERNDKDLIAVIEELGDEANGRCGKIRIVEIPDDISWEIHDYDGMESVEEIHRSWC